MNRQKSQELIRIENMINTDRLKTNKEFELLFQKDITAILNEYFIMSDSPKIAIERKGKNIIVSVLASVNTIKTFSIIQEN